jgi:hypothetical protein
MWNRRVATALLASILGAKNPNRLRNNGKGVLMKDFKTVVSGPSAASAWLVLVAGLVLASPSAAGPVVREATGLNAAAIQAAVDAFRNDLGGPNNGTMPGSQAAGRREITWDGGGAEAAAATFPVRMTTFANRGAIFVTPGSGFEISGQPSSEFGDLNGLYPNLFATFSIPRLFTPLNTNVMDVVFSVPGNEAVPAAVTGFGSVFTDVDSETSTKLEFYAPDGTLLFERSVLATAGNESLSFLGVSFDAGEVVARVRIISGNAALGPDETGTLDLVVMDDFIYGEPVSTLGLTIAPTSGILFRQGAFDIVVKLDNPVAFVEGQVRLDGMEVTGPFVSCVRDAKPDNGGSAFRCPAPRGFLSVGEHVLQVVFNLADGTRVRNAVGWMIQNIEP